MTAAVLLRNETIKTTRRTAFWVTLLSFLGLLSLIFGENVYSTITNPAEAEPFALPGAWTEIVGETGPLGPFFAAIILIMLVSNEFSWKTARQNVIDGLSKDQWFAGKLMLLPFITLTFFAALLLVGGGVALWGTDLGATSAPLLRGADAAVLGGLLLAILEFLALAFVLAILLRSAGPAMGVFFFYIGILERLLGGLLAKLGAGAVVPFLPFEIFQRLIEPIHFSSDALAAAVARAQEAERAAPEAMDPGLLVAAALAWVVAFCAIAYLGYRRQDL